LDEIAEAKDMVSRVSISRVFGVVGWVFVLIWRCCLLLVHNSPFYVCLETNWISTAVIFALVLAPNMISIIVPKRFVSYKSLAILAAIAGCCIVIEPFFKSMMYLSIILLSVALWILHIIFLPYITMHMMSYRQQGIRAIAEALLMTGIALISSVIDSALIIGMLPVMALVIFIPCHYFAPKDLGSMPAEEAFRQKGKLPHSAMIKTFESCITGACVGCIFAAAVSEVAGLLILALNFLGSGLFLTLGEKFLLKKMSLAIAFFMLFAIAPPILLSIPFIDGLALGIVGAVGMCVGRTKTVVGVRIGLDTSKPILQQPGPFVASWERLFDTLGLFLGISLATFTFSTHSPFIISLVYCVLLYLVLIVIALYAGSVIFDYENFIQNTDTLQPILIANEEKKPWGKKIELVAKRSNLTSRQREVLHYVARGHNAEHIAKEMYLSLATVKSHIYAIYKKTHVHSQQELINIVEKVSIKK